MTTKEPAGLSRGTIDTTALALFGAMFLGLALVGGSSLWAPISSVFQHVTHSFGIGSTSALETEQRRHADAIKKLERGLIKLGLEQDILTRSRIRPARR